MTETPPRGGGLINKLKTVCRNGHEYSPENTILVKNGKSRLCRICRDVINKRSIAKAKTIKLEGM